jgi:hypothetical protein
MVRVAKPDTDRGDVDGAAPGEVAVAESGGYRGAGGGGRSPLNGVAVLRSVRSKAGRINRETEATAAADGTANLASRM